MSVRKKPVAVLLAAILCAGAAALLAQKPANPTPAASSVVGAALKTAQAQKKNVFVHFGASWCTWCRHLDALLMGPEFGKVFSDSYVITHLTIQESDDKKALENPGAQEMVEQAGASKAGVPVFLILDPSGKRLATSLAMPNGGNIGHPVTPEEVQAFMGLLEKTAPRMTAAQRAEIAGHLAGKKY